MNSTTEWYRSIKKPEWAPAESVFGQVWSVLYPIIIVVNVYLIIQVVTKKLDWRIGLPFWLNLAFNLAFSPLQFGLRSNVLALIDILLVLGTLIWAIIAVWPDYRWISVAYAPYLVWVSIATALQASITWLNR